MLDPCIPAPMPNVMQVHVLSMGEQLHEQALADRIAGTQWKRAVALKPTGGLADRGLLCETCETSTWLRRAPLLPGVCWLPHVGGSAPHHCWSLLLAEPPHVTRHTRGQPGHFMVPWSVRLPVEIGWKEYQSRTTGARCAGWTWRQKGGLDVRDMGAVKLVGVPYSEHSSFPELRQGLAGRLYCVGFRVGPVRSSG